MTTRILIIDDERDLCHLLKLVLLKERYLVDCAFCLMDAGKKLLRNPQIIFLDNNLPDGSGLEYFHNHPKEFFNCSVILITADGSPSVKMHALDMGIDIFIEKPFSVKEIRDIITKICLQKSLH
jgi:DNA-binding response OmpR family regulator